MLPDIFGSLTPGTADAGVYGRGENRGLGVVGRVIGRGQRALARPQGLGLGRPLLSRRRPRRHPPTSLWLGPDAGGYRASPPGSRIAFAPAAMLALIPLLIVGPVGFALTLAAIRLLIGGVKTGGVHLHLAAVPVPLGGPMRGELTPSKPIPTGKPVRLKLECISFSTTYNNSQDEFSTIPTWCGRTRQPLPPTAAAPSRCPSSRLPMRPPPRLRSRVGREGMRNTRACTGSNGISAPTIPVARSRTTTPSWGLPVFKVAKPPHKIADAESISASRKAEIESYQPDASFNVRITQVDGGTEYHFPPVRVSGPGDRSNGSVPGDGRHRRRLHSQRL